MKKRTQTLLTTLVLMLLPALAAADVQLIGTGLSIWSREQTLDPSTAAPVTQSAASSTPMLLPAGTGRHHAPYVAVISTESAADCAFVGLATLDLAGAEVTDPSGPNGTGPGSSVAVHAQQPVVHRSLWKLRDEMEAAGASGFSEGLCSAAVTVRGLDLFPPCRTSADCTTFGAGSCIAEPSTAAEQSAGILVVCEGGQVRIDMEKVPGWQP